ncbi:hypothetical protein [Archangium minus]
MSLDHTRAANVEGLVQLLRGLCEKASRLEQRGERQPSRGGQRGLYC